MCETKISAWGKWVDEVLVFQERYWTGNNNHSGWEAVLVLTIKGVGTLSFYKDSFNLHNRGYIFPSITTNTYSHKLVHYIKKLVHSIQKGIRLAPMQPLQSLCWLAAALPHSYIFVTCAYVNAIIFVWYTKTTHSKAYEASFIKYISQAVGLTRRVA